MSVPTDLANLYTWHKVSSLNLNEGDAWSSQQLVDSSGNGRFGQGTNAGGASPTYPIFRKNRLAGYPSMDQTNGAGLPFSYFYYTYSREHLANVTRFIVWKAPSSQPGGGMFTASSGGSGSEACYYYQGNFYTRWLGLTAQFITPAIAATADVWHYACSWQADASIIGASVDGGTEYTRSLTEGRNATYPVAGSTINLGCDGGSFCWFEWCESFCFSRTLDASERGLMNNYLRDKYFQVAPGQVEQVRDIISRRLWSNRRASGQFEIVVPQWALDLDILDIIAVEYEKGPAAQAEGWKAKKYQRPNWSIQREVWSPAEQTVKLTVLCRSALDVLLWDTACTDERNSGGMHSGIARMGKVCGGWTHSRESLAYIDNPADDTTVITCGNNEESINKNGAYFEEQRVNRLLRSSAVAGTGGLTISAPNSGASITAVTDDLFFTTDISLYSLKFVHGSPTTSDTKATWPDTASLAANTRVVVSFDYRIESGSPLYWQLMRVYDSQYWNDSAGTWGGATSNSLGNVTSRNNASRVVSKVINIGANASALRLVLLLRSGDTANSISRLYHCQIEDGYSVSTRIVTDAATYTRVKSQWSQPVATSGKFYDPALGGVYVEYLPEANSADLASGTKLYLWYMTTNGGADHDACLYNVTNGRFEFERKVGASTYVAYKAATLTRGTRVAVGCRWTGVEGEWGLPQYTASIFVDKVKGTDVTTAAPTFTSPETFYRGQDSSAANQCNGALREWRFFPRPPHNDEMGRQP